MNPDVVGREIGREGDAKDTPEEMEQMDRRMEWKDIRPNCSSR
jgi:hypothetical protein